MKRMVHLTFTGKNSIRLSLISLLLLLLLNSCQTKHNYSDPEKSILCDAENIDKSGNKFISKRKLYDIEFGNGFTRSSECAFSGKCSSKTDSINPYGIFYEIKNLNTNDVYRISVWRKSSDTTGVIALQGFGDNDSFYYDRTFKNVVDKSNGWEKIEGIFTVPKNDKVTKLRIFVFNPSKKVMYFDDLMISDETDN